MFSSPLTRTRTPHVHSNCTPTCWDAHSLVEIMVVAQQYGLDFALGPDMYKSVRPYSVRELRRIGGGRFPNETEEQAAQKRWAAPQCDTEPAVTIPANRIDGHDRRGSPAKSGRRVPQTAEFQSEPAAEGGQSHAQFFSRRAAKTSTS